MSAYRVVIADDEALLRDAMRDALAAEPVLDVVAVCADGDAALEAIVDERPDIAFLDVQMPGLSGIQVVEALPPELRPAIVFVTAHDAYAIRAFEMNAVDYLLKPFDAERLHQTVQRLADRLGRAAPAPPPGLDAAVRSLHRTTAYAERLLPVAAGRVQVIHVAAIEWLEGADNYVRVHAGARTGLLRETLAALEARLDPARFARVHRSAIVNLGHIVELRPRTNGDYRIVLTSGGVATLSRTYSAQVLQRLR